MKSVQRDILCGFLVFLIALPLSIGIAMASGFPPLSGLMTAAIGGLVAGFMTGAPMTIKGPAAGLIVIVLGAIDAFGGLANHGIEKALATIVIAGALQSLFALVRAGKMADFFPTSAVHGMLAAIGVIIIAKQVHVALGVNPAAKSPLALLAEIPQSVMHLNPEIALIGCLSLAIMFMLPHIHKLRPLQFLKQVPAPLVVLGAAVPLGLVFHLATKHAYNFLGSEFSVGPNFLINIPANLKDAYIRPDFSEIFSSEALKYIIMFALVGSLESLLTVKAIDSLDPEKRKSNTNKDLLAVGIGNMLAGMLGGLPMISEVVRSSANLANGAKSKYANIIHGFFILAFVAFVPQLLHMIPSAALAGVLVFTGYRLASPHHWKESWHVGREQFAVFAITVVMTLATDLLVGIFTGVAIEFAVNFFHGARFKTLFHPHVKVHHHEEENHLTIHLHDALTFSNFPQVVGRVTRLSAQRVTINVGQVRFADHTAVKSMENLRLDLVSSGREVAMVGLDELAPMSSHPLSALKFASDEQRASQRATSELS